MEVKRFGLIKFIDSNKKIIHFLGFGEYLGDFPKEDDFLGISVDTPKIKMDNGDIVWGTDVSFFTEAVEMEKNIENFKKEGYKIEQIV